MPKSVTGCVSHMQRIVVIAPHPDDETLGCGGTLLKHKAQGDEVHWVIATTMTKESGFSTDAIGKRQREINAVGNRFGFHSVHQLGFAAAQLDTIPLSIIVQKLGAVFRELRPQVIYVPFRNDAHTDHRIVFDGVAACTKWFRYPGIERVLAYETLSETEFGIDPTAGAFKPNVFVDISEHIDEKIDIMSIYDSEYDEFPFPRSERAMRALAEFRGSTIGRPAAEAFLLLKEVW